MKEHPSVDTVPELLSLHARTRGSAPAIVDPDRQSLSYATLCREVEHTGALLAESGLGRGHRIAVALPNGTETAVVMLAAMSFAVCVPLDPSLESSAYRSLFEGMRVDALFAPQGEDLPSVNAARALGLRVLRLASSPEGPGAIPAPDTETTSPRVVPGRLGSEDLALVMATSGTTAQPKIVPLTHAQLLARARLSPLTGSDCGICAAPMFTASGIVTGLLATLAAGASIMLPQVLDAARIVELLERLQPSYLWASPTIHAAVLEVLASRKSEPPKSLRYLRSGSSALHAALQSRLERAYGVPVLQGYGMTETGVIARNPLPPEPRRPGSVGRPLGSRVAILGSGGSFLHAGEVGEIVVQGPGVMSGYENAEANRAAFHGEWFRTGDLGYFDEDGYLFLTGRIHESINRGGLKVAPSEVDAVFLAHEAVLEAATFAVGHPSLGEDVAAAVVLRQPGSLTAQQLRAYAFERLASFKVPTTVILVDRLPKNALGKVQRSALPDAFRESLHPRFLAPRDGDEAFVAGIFAEVLGLQRVGAFDNFFELGGDSLSGTRVVVRVNSARGVNLSVVSLFETPIVADFAGAVRQAARPTAP